MEAHLGEVPFHILALNHLVLHDSVVHSALPERRRVLGRRPPLRVPAGLQRARLRRPHLRPEVLQRRPLQAQGPEGELQVQKGLRRKALPEKVSANSVTLRPGSLSYLGF